MGVQIPHGKGQFFWGKGHPFVKFGDTTVICAKTAELVEIPFGLWVWMGSRNRVIWGSTGAKGCCHGNQFLAFDGL